LEAYEVALVGLWLGWEKFQSQSEVETWLNRIARNALASHRRKKLLRKEVHFEDLTPGQAESLLVLPAEEESSEEAIEARLDVESLLAKLPVRTAQILRLRYLQGWKLKRIAAELGMSVSGVSDILRAVHKRLCPREKE